MQPDTLIHLISDQTMQNVLPVLAYKPRRVVQVMSSPGPGDKFLKRTRWIRDAAELAVQRNPGLSPAPEIWPDAVSLGTGNPRIEETRQAVASLLAQHPGALVNYTGGTKNMSIGAWLAARDAVAPTLYCDTPVALCDGGTGPLPPTANGSAIPDLPALARTLGPEVILASQGLHEGTHWLRGEISPGEREFGSTCFALTQRHGDVVRKYREALMNHGMTDGKTVSKDCCRAATTPVPCPPADQADQLIPLLDAACSTGLLFRDGDDFFYQLDGAGTSGKAAKRRVGEIARALSGVAFEFHVDSLLRRSRKFSGFIPNIRPANSQPGDASFGESDFLAYDPAQLSLTLISCKTDPPGLEHLESLLARKQTFGGLFAAPLILVEFGADSNRSTTFRARCKALGIQCAVGDEIENVLQADPATPAPLPS
jgi:hypothetical protein